MLSRVQWPRIIFGLVGLCLTVTPRSNTNRPSLDVSNVVNAAGHIGGKVSPGEMVVLYPSKAGPKTLKEYRLDSEVRFATSIGETRVLFDGIPAPIYYATSGRLMAIVPYEVAHKSQTRINIEYQGSLSAGVTLPVVESVPALFTLDASGRGQAAMLNQLGCCNSARNPAARGTIVSLYATGAGQTVPNAVDGNFASYDRVADIPVPKQEVRVTVGQEPAEIVYASESTPAGLLQVNFRVPPTAPIGGAVPLMLTVGSATSPGGVTMAIKSEVPRILLIEDEAEIRNRIKRSLPASGYEILDELLAGNPPDLVIGDLAMPQDEMTMLQALRLKRPQLKVIAIARDLDTVMLRTADLMGAQAVLTRPLRDEVVLRRVRQVLSEVPLPSALPPTLSPSIPH